MYQTISKEMMTMFASIKDFSNLFCEPVEKYRDRYKKLEKLRQLFFEKVDNEPDLDRFIEFYKWIDTSLSAMILQLVPASTEYSKNIRNLVESHVLERSKYKHKFPYLDTAKSTEASIRAHSILYKLRENLSLDEEECLHYQIVKKVNEKWDVHTISWDVSKEDAEISISDEAREIIISHFK